MLITLLLTSLAGIQRLLASTITASGGAAMSTASGLATTSRPVSTPATAAVRSPWRSGSRRATTTRPRPASTMTYSE